MRKGLMYQSFLRFSGSCFSLSLRGRGGHTFWDKVPKSYFVPYEETIALFTDEEEGSGWRSHL